MTNLDDRFALTSRVVVVTGGGGLLGREHALAVAAAGGLPVLLDVDEVGMESAAEQVHRASGAEAMTVRCDITREDDVRAAHDRILGSMGRIDGLINNAARDPKVDDPAEDAWGGFETFPLDAWTDDLDVILTGSFLCSRAFGATMAEQSHGSIVNILSDLALIAPDHRIYGEGEGEGGFSSVKPVSYSVAKTGLLGLTRYLAAYWARRGVRVNALSPGGVYAGQDDAFVARLTSRIPMARMAAADEYAGCIVFLLSDASSYMTGANLVVDGGRTVI